MDVNGTDVDNTIPTRIEDTDDYSVLGQFIWTHTTNELHNAPNVFSFQIVLSMNTVDITQQ